MGRNSKEKRWDQLVIYRISIEKVGVRGSGSKNGGGGGRGTGAWLKPG